MKESKCDAVIVDAIGGATADKIVFSDTYGGIVECWAYGSIRYTVNGKLAALPADVKRAAKAEIRRLNDAREKHMGLVRGDDSVFGKKSRAAGQPAPAGTMQKSTIRALRASLAR